MELGFAVVAALLFLAWLTERRWLLWPAFLLSLGLGSGLSLCEPPVRRPRLAACRSPTGCTCPRRRSGSAGCSRSALVVWPRPRAAADGRSGASREIAGPLVALVVAAGRLHDVQALPARSTTSGRSATGRLLLVKLALVCLALAWGAFHHFVVRAAARARPSRAAGRAAAGGASLGEATVAVSILLLRRDPGRLEAAAEAGSAADAGRWPPAGSVRRDASGRSPEGPGSSACTSRGGSLADGHEVRTLDLAPLDDAELERGVEELRGDVRSPPTAAGSSRARTCSSTRRPRCRSRPRASRSARSTSSGTATLLAAAAEAGVRRVVLVSSTAVYGVPKVHPIYENDPLVGVGWYGESKIEAEQVCARLRPRGLEFAIVRPKTFIGPERLGVFEILFDWIREGRRIYVLGSGTNRYQLLAVEDLVDAIVLAAERAEAAGETVNVGASEFGTVRDDLAGADRPRRLRRRGCGRSRRGRPRSRCARSSCAHLSPLAEWHYKTAHRDSFVDVSKAERLLGWDAALSNARGAVPDLRLVPRAPRGARATRASRTACPWNQQALGLLKKLERRLLEQHAAASLRRSNPDRLVDSSAWSRCRPRSRTARSRRRRPRAATPRSDQPRSRDRRGAGRQRRCRPPGSGPGSVCDDDPQAAGHPPAGRSSATTTCRAPPGRARAAPPADRG